METKELRIGNWIYLCGYLHGFEIRFDGAEREMELSGFILGKLLSYRPGKTFDFINEVKPIKLTEEWFIRLGLSQYNNNELDPLQAYQYKITYEAVYSDWIIYFQQFEKNDWTVFTVSYVHQLQNLFFALTSNELVLKA